MSTPLTFLLVMLFLAVIVCMVYVMVQVAKLRDTGRPDLDSLTLLQNQVAQLQRDLGERMGQTHDAIRQNFASSTSVVRDVTEKLTRMEETTKQVLDATGQLQRLQDMLKNPKQRGILGEYYLETLLGNALPPDVYRMQYPFKDGEIVDAALFVNDKIVLIDSKFSLENYNRMIEAATADERDKWERAFLQDLKDRIKETAKYIRPEEGTMDFAFMFIPHEAIYYDLLVNKIGASLGEGEESIIQRAAGKYHVIIVSPTSFLAYLQTVLQGLRALKIEEQAKVIRTRVEELGRHLAAYEGYFKSLGKNLGTAVNQYNLASKEFVKIDKDMLKMTGTALNIEAVALEKPILEE